MVEPADYKLVSVPIRFRRAAAGSGYSYTFATHTAVRLFLSPTPEVEGRLL
jgi:hypothetical protein